MGEHDHVFGQDERQEGESRTLLAIFALLAGRGRADLRSPPRGLLLPVSGWPTGLEPGGVVEQRADGAQSTADSAALPLRSPASFLVVQS